MINELKVKYYVAEILKTKIGNYRGTRIMAKPIFLLAIINCIDNASLAENKIHLDDEVLKNEYLRLFAIYQPQIIPSAFILPYFHLSSETYYSINWTGNPFIPHPKAHSPSLSYLKNNSTHSYLDHELWALLQDYETRSYFKQVLLNVYFHAK